MAPTVSSLPGFAYCSNDLNNAANGRSALVLASTGALDLKALAPAALAPQNPQEPYPSVLEAFSGGAVQGSFPLNGGPFIGGGAAAGGLNHGQTVT